MATAPSKRPSLRRASQTVPMPPTPSATFQPVRTDHLSGQCGEQVGADVGRIFEESRTQDTLVLAQYPAQRRGHGRRLLRGRGEQRLACGRFELQRAIEQRAEREPERLVHMRHFAHEE